MMLCRTASATAPVAKQQRRAAAAPRATRTAVVVRASQAEPAVSRRQIAGAASALLAAAFYAPPAHALFGLGGDNKAAAEEYTKDTTNVLALVTEAVSLEKDAPDREERIADIRKQINGWVAKYRRNDQFAGRPSFGNTYAVCNTLAGHYNSFGVKAPLPKKRLERLTRELEDAQKLLERGR